MGQILHISQRLDVTFIHDREFVLFILELTKSPNTYYVVEYYLGEG